jgi:hypothetical protein
MLIRNLMSQRLRSGISSLRICRSNKNSFEFVGNNKIGLLRGIR